MANQQQLKKGYAAPLEGESSVRFMLNLAFLGIGLTMLANLGNAPSAEINNTLSAKATPKLGGPTLSSFATPRPPTNI